MNACPNDGVLLQFLDGDLNAEDDAQILAHLEDCARCQEHLERLTGGQPVPGEGPPIETVRNDADPTVDLLPTEIAARPGGTAGDLRPTEPASTRDQRSGAAAEAGPDRGLQHRSGGE